MGRFCKKQRARTPISVLALAATLLAAAPSDARDVFVVRAQTLPEGPCGSNAGWRDHLVFFNTTNVEQRVIPLAASNGYEIPAGQDVLIPPRRILSVVHGVNHSGGVVRAWTPPPFGRPILFVNKLEVPEGVLLESRMEIYATSLGIELPCPQFPSLGVEVGGHFAFPVIDQLNLAGVPHYHLAADLGTLTSRTNVGVYNAEESAGTATIEMRAACDDRLLEIRSTSVPGNSLVYVQGLRNTFLDTTCFGGQDAADYSRYVVVTMDRAGFSFVAARAETLPPRVTAGSTTSR